MTLRMSQPARNVLGYLSKSLRWSLVGFWVTVMIVALSIGLAGRYRNPGAPDVNYLELIGGATKGYMMVIGILATPIYLPLFVTHGTTRRDFVKGSLAFAALLSVAATAVLYLSYLLQEAGAQPYKIGQGHLFTALNQPLLIFVEYSLLLMAFFVSGWLIGSAYYRFGWVKGLFFMAVSLLPVVGLEWVMQDVPTLLHGSLRTGPLTLLICAASGLGLIALGLWLHRWVVRDLAIRRRVG